MSQVACVVLPVMALQILWRRRPEWRGKPVAVVGDETPEAPLLLLSDEARASGLRLGLRQGAARNLVLDLCTAVVAPEELEALARDLARALQAFSPRVEPASFQGVSFPGTSSGVAPLHDAFFVDPSGLERLYGGLDGWARSVARYFRGRGLLAGVVVGFERYRTYALARRTPGVRVVVSPEEEVALTDPIGLRELGIGEKLCDPLAMLGVSTFGAFVALPAGELHSRFGKQAATLHRLFCGEAQLPMQPLGFEEPRRVAREISPPDGDRERLLFVIKGMLDGLVNEIAEAGERLDALVLTLHLELHPRGHDRASGMRLSDAERKLCERLEPASPTADARALLELVRLRLTNMSVPADVEEIVLLAETRPLRGEQLSTVTERPRRDRRAAAEALARVRATFGDESVAVARLRDAHLPEASYAFECGDGLSASLEHCAGTAVLAQRRLLPKPRVLSSDAEGRPLMPDPIVRLNGPHRLNGGWWGRRGEGAATIDRDYFYAETAGGELLFVFFDRRRSRWFLHGRLD